MIYDISCFVTTQPLQLVDLLYNLEDNLVKKSSHRHKDEYRIVKTFLHLKIIKIRLIFV